LGYDVIGDIHGHATKLEALLERLGYARRAASWVPPAGRQAIFLGDLIDRGPEQTKVVRIVRTMIDAGHARCVMGNHEFNAIGYATPRRGRVLVAWFATLSPTLDPGAIRVVRGWWHQPHVDLVVGRIAPGTRMDQAFLHAAFTPGCPEREAMEGLTKGLEIPLPDGHFFLDHGGVPQTSHVACLDYSAAKGGPLVAYRWDGEATLDPRRFVQAG
jgi:hypothetical protein